MMVIPEIMCEIVNTLRWIEGLKAWELYGKQILILEISGSLTFEFEMLNLG